MIIGISNKEKFQLVGIVTLVMGLALTIGRVDVEDAKTRAKDYCAMVDLYAKSKGESGWPDYKGNYDSVCTGTNRIAAIAK